jgi:hypothetical protein
MFGRDNKCNKCVSWPKEHPKIISHGCWEQIESNSFIPQSFLHAPMEPRGPKF